MQKGDDVKVIMLDGSEVSGMLIEMNPTGVKIRVRKGHGILSRDTFHEVYIPFMNIKTITNMEKSA
jgi:hypothetical protein